MTTALRAATPEDVPPILDFTRELAEYEGLLDQVVADQTLLAENLFGARPQAEIVIAEHRRRPAGFALFFDLSRPPRFVPGGSVRAP